MAGGSEQADRAPNAALPLPVGGARRSGPPTGLLLLHLEPPPHPFHRPAAPWSATWSAAPPSPAAGPTLTTLPATWWTARCGAAPALRRRCLPARLPAWGRIRRGAQARLPVGLPACAAVVAAHSSSRRYPRPHRPPASRWTWPASSPCPPSAPTPLTWWPPGAPAPTTTEPAGAAGAACQACWQLVPAPCGCRQAALSPVLCMHAPDPATHPHIPDRTPIPDPSTPDPSTQSCDLSAAATPLPPACMY